MLKVAADGEDAAEDMIGRIEAAWKRLAESFTKATTVEGHGLELNPRYHDPDHGDRYDEVEGVLRRRGGVPAKPGGQEVRPPKSDGGVLWTSGKTLPAKAPLRAVECPATRAGILGRQAKGSPMKQTAIFPGRYVQAEGAIADLGEEIQRLGSKALLIVGKTAEDKIVPAYLPAWRKLVGVTVERFGGESSEEEIERLASVAKEQGCDVVVGMGGGKAIDTAKAVGYAVQARTAIVPTIASTDAPTSAVAVIYTATAPSCATCSCRGTRTWCWSIPASSPRPRCGTWSPAWATPCPPGSRPTPAGRRTRPTSAAGWGRLPATRLARLCYDTIREYGVAARIACEQKVVTPALAHVVEANTLLSGLGFEARAGGCPFDPQRPDTAPRHPRLLPWGESGDRDARRALPGGPTSRSSERSTTSASRWGCRRRLQISAFPTQATTTWHRRRSGLRRGGDDPSRTVPDQCRCRSRALKTADRFGRSRRK